jgi:glycerol-3-phosphate acyltransferase PlsY
MTVETILFLASVLGYGLGSIPFGLVLTKAAGLGDIRAIGSGNIGATNVLRTGNKKLAAATLLLDGLKGTVAVLIAAHWGPDAALAAGVGAFLGHLFPVWLKFSGGKGVATLIGILFGIAWPVALGFIALWLACAKLTRYSSLSALVASASTPLIFLISGHGSEALVFAFLVAVLWWKHRANIARLRAGTEGKIGAKA